MHATEYIKPRQLAAAIGVSESSLKRWSDKGLLPSVKTAGGHRRLPMWGVLEFLRVSGQPVLRPQLIGLPTPLAGPEPVTLGKLVPNFVGMIVAGHTEEALSAVIRAYLSGSSPCELCDELFRAAMEQVGAMWERGELDVYEEHRASQVLARVLAQLRTIQRPPSVHAPIAFGAAPPGDPYSLASAMIEWVLVSLGWRASTLGPDTPLESLTRAAVDLRPRLIWLSISAPTDGGTFVSAYQRFYDVATGMGSSVAIGGRGVTDDLRNRISFSSFGTRLRHLVCFVECLARREGLGPVMGDADDDEHAC